MILKLLLSIQMLYWVFWSFYLSMQDVHKNIDKYNPAKKRKILIVFDDMIPDMINNKKLNSLVTEMFIRGIKLNISLVWGSKRC